MTGPAEKFVHLHNHSHYSLLDGALRIEDMVGRAKALGQSAIAISDHGNMFGVIEFYSAALKAGVKPIVGCEMYVAPGDRRDRDAKGISDASYHLLLLAMNRTGYQNLLRLSSIAYREGFYYRPRIDKAVLAEHSDGLICSSSCLAGELPSKLLLRDADAARQVAEDYLKIFGPDRYFIEIQDHGLDEQKQTNPELVELARRLGVGVIATNDSHYLDHGDAPAHDVLCCINTGKLLDDPDRFRFGSDQFYLKSGRQMQDLFASWPEALENTAAVAARCNLELDFSRRHAPVFHPPAELKLTPQQYLRQLADEGLRSRFGEGAGEEVRRRLDRELDVIESKGFSSYFLIVWDLLRFAREQGIPAAPRGSGCGTLLGYVLGIGNVNPLTYGLLFERFMDPSRNEMPDIDIDICQVGRARLIEYVREKYGHVAQIITFNTLAARAAIRDVGRVLNVPLPAVDRIAKMVPAGPKVTLDSALAGEPELRSAYDSDPDTRRVIDIARRLEGLARNASIHAAGVVIADRPLDHFLPLCGTDPQEVITQFEGPMVDKIGLLKMDFLGLRTLTVIERARQLVKANHGVEIDPEALPLDDAKVFELFARGQTDGVFQFESGGMKDLLVKLGPDRLEDLIACNALYRPGPMQMIDDFCSRKRTGQWPTVHPVMDRILEETYGIMVYQEQVMQIANQIGGIELSRAYKLIKAISKKNDEIIGAEHEAFIAGAQERGIRKAQAEELFDLILRFAGYGFNKSHSTRYAIVAYQTAWLKVHYPLEYMAALLTYEMIDQKKTVQYIEECRRMGIDVLPPDVNACDADFTVDRSAGTADGGRGARGAIRFGLAAVKGVGERAVESIIAAIIRPGMTQRQKAEAVYEFVRNYRYHWAPAREGEQRGDFEYGVVYDPVKLLNVYGYGYCFQTAPLLETLYQAAGLEARGCGIGGHAICEVYYDGAYHYYDADQHGYFLLADGKTVASMDQLSRDPVRLVLNQPNPSTPFFPATKNPLVPYESKVLVAAYFASRENNHTRHDKVDRGHRMDIALAPGMRYVRRFQPRGQWNFRHGEIAEDCRVGYVDPAVGPKDHLSEKSYGNGYLLWQPDLSSATQEYRLGVWSDTNIAQDERGLTPARAGEPAHAIFRVRVPYAIVGWPTAWTGEPRPVGAAVVSASFVRGEGDEQAISVSVDGGRTWTGVWKSERAGESAAVVDLSERVVPRYEYLVRVEMRAGERPGGCRLDRLAIRTSFQLNPSTLPALRDGRTRMNFSLGEQTETWELTADLSSPQALLRDAQSVRGVWLEGGQVKGRYGRSGEIVYQFEPPRPGAVLRVQAVAGCRREPGELNYLDDVKIYWAENEPRNWRLLADDDVPPYAQHWSNTLAGEAVCKAARRVYVKFAIRTESGSSLRMLRVRAHWRPDQAGDSPLPLRGVRIVHGWTECEGSDGRRVEKRFETVVGDAPTEYVVEAGRDVVNRFVTIEPVRDPRCSWRASSCSTVGTWTTLHSFVSPPA